MIHGESDAQACQLAPAMGNLNSLAAISSGVMTANQCSKVTRTDSGKSSFYGKGDGFHGQKTFCGTKFIASQNTIALPQGKVARPGAKPTAGQVACGTMVRLTNPKNGKTTYATVTDTGGFAKYGRMADVSYGVALKLGFVSAGHTTLKMEVCGG